MKMETLKYQIFDTECLKGGYFSYQWRNENMETAKLLECTSDEDCYRFYSSLKKANRSMYCYSINYDKTMLNALCKFVEKDIEDIPNKLRRVNDYIIMGNINYFRLNREFWCNLYFPNQDNYTDKSELFKDCINKMCEKGNMYLSSFLEEFPYLLGQSKVFKNLNIIDIPKMLYYFSIRKDGIIRPTISLKDIQLNEEGYNITHDFEGLFDIDEIKNQGQYEDFVKYALNDVDFLFRYFQKKCIPMIENRIKACDAIKMFNPEFEVTEKMIHSENNTNLLVNAFSLTDLPEVPEGYNICNEDDIKKLYSENIKPTGFEQFDRLVEFVNNNPSVKKDKKLKELFCEHYDEKYIQDDSQQEHEGQIMTIVDSFDTFNLFGTLTTTGLGGIHGAIENYKNEKLYHADYQAFYPSIILKFKKYYSQLINITLYESLYNFRNYEVKVELKKIEEKLKGNLDDFERKELLELGEKYEYLSDGCKLLLNSLYGLINSEFNFSVSHKQLGRFICLYGQYRAIELCKAIKAEYPHSNIVNLNTDGVIIDNIDEFSIKGICVADRQDDYVILEVKKIDKIIQNDVNNYIKFANGKMKTKGNAFKLGIKQQFCRFEKLPCNIQNALSLLEHKNKVEILPVLFHQKSKKKSTITLEGEESSRNKVYYLTTEDKGTKAIKHIAQPLILSWGGEIMYFTTNEEDADPNVYLKFASMTRDKIENFKLNEKDNMKYYEKKLEEDGENFSNKNSFRRLLNKIFHDKLCIIDKEKKVMCIDKKPVDEYANYNMTQILKSKESFGFSILNDENIIALSTNNKEDIETLDSYGTFTALHKSGHKLYIFNSNEFDFNTGDLKNTMILNNEYVPIVTLDGEFNCNVQTLKEVKK